MLVLLDLGFLWYDDTLSMDESRLLLIPFFRSLDCCVLVVLVVLAWASFLEVACDIFEVDFSDFAAGGHLMLPRDKQHLRSVS